jgi:hypothetical protein
MAVASITLPEHRDDYVTPDLVVLPGKHGETVPLPGPPGRFEDKSQ